jgi:threonine dehydratase
LIAWDEVPPGIFCGGETGGSVFRQDKDRFTSLSGHGFKVKRTSPVRRDAGNFGFIVPAARTYAGAMQLPSLAQIREAQSVVYRHMPPTPQYSWPLINLRLSAGQLPGVEAWIKHENHTPVGAFKLRGALVYMDWLKQTQPNLAGVVAATRGNHGQGVGMAARLLGLKAIIVVPHGNSKEKNRAMLAQGVELLEHGHDFQESLEFARTLAEERGFTMVDSFHERLVMGTATYALELFEGAPTLDAVYVPIGLGSSICGVASARGALGLATEIVGVVAQQSPSYALSFAQYRVIEAPSLTEIADGLACRKPNPLAMEVIWKSVARIVEVSESAIAEAMRALYQDTHNLAEGAGAAGLAGALKEKQQLQGKRIGIVLTGGNVDREMYERVLAGASSGESR